MIRWVLLSPLFLLLTAYIPWYGFSKDVVTFKENGSIKQIALANVRQVKVMAKATFNTQNIALRPGFDVEFEILPEGYLGITFSAH